LAKKARPKPAPKKPLPERADGLPPLKGVALDDALKAAMETKLPKDWKPPKANEEE
jgi:hypothetical protein